MGKIRIIKMLAVFLLGVAINLSTYAFDNYETKMIQKGAKTKSCDLWCWFSAGLIGIAATIGSRVYFCKKRKKERGIGSHGKEVCRKIIRYSKQENDDVVFPSNYSSLPGCEITINKDSLQILDKDLVEIFNQCQNTEMSWKKKDLQNLLRFGPIDPDINAYNDEKLTIKVPINKLELCDTDNNIITLNDSGNKCIIFKTKITVLKMWMPEKYDLQDDSTQDDSAENNNSIQHDNVPFDKRKLKAYSMLTQEIIGKASVSFNIRDHLPESFDSKNSTLFVRYRGDNNQTLLIPISLTPTKNPNPKENIDCLFDNSFNTSDEKEAIDSFSDSSHSDSFREHDLDRTIDCGRNTNLKESFAIYLASFKFVHPQD